MLEQIPFLQNCEDEDSDEDDELDSVQHKKQRVKVCSSLPLRGGRPLRGPAAECPCGCSWGSLYGPVCVRPDPVPSQGPCLFSSQAAASVLCQSPPPHPHPCLLPAPLLLAHVPERPELSRQGQPCAALLQHALPQASLVTVALRYFWCGCGFLSFPSIDCELCQAGTMGVSLLFSPQQPE